jgi:hypothetical protein
MHQDRIVGAAETGAGNINTRAVVKQQEPRHGWFGSASTCARTLSLALAIAGPALVTACSDQSLREEAGGESAGVKGDWVAATPLFEQAYAAHPDVVSQFNLATAYENTGQNAKAIALYEAVVLDGDFTETNLSTPTGGVTEPSQGVDLSAEATKRLAIMASRKALLEELDLLANRKVLPVEKVLVCDFPGRNGNGAGRFGEIIVYVDDDRQTASTLGFFVAAANQQEVDRFDNEQIVWTQRYQFVGHTDTYRYRLSRRTHALDVTRPFPDTSKEVKVTASCHTAKGA